MLPFSYYASLAVLGAGTPSCESGSAIPEAIRCGSGTVPVEGECVPDLTITCGTGTVDQGGVCVPEANKDNINPALSSAVINPPNSIPYFGDLWINTWASDDNLYLMWGDGTGLSNCLPSTDSVSPGFPVIPEIWSSVETPPTSGCLQITEPLPFPAVLDLYCRVFNCNRCYPLCTPMNGSSSWTATGMLRLTCSPPDFTSCQGTDNRRSIHVPQGDFITSFTRNDKPSSLTSTTNQLILAGHFPASFPTDGYMAISGNFGLTWTEAPGSPWTGASPFKVMMFINMGQANSAAKDSYLYALAVEKELQLNLADPTIPVPILQVFLARVPTASAEDVLKYDGSLYNDFEYFSGTATAPTWSTNQGDAVSIGPETFVTSSAMYHEGTERYLFLAGVTDWDWPTFSQVTGKLYEAPKPWGPWTEIATVPNGEIKMLLAKGAGSDFVYYTTAGLVEYNFHVGRFDLK